MQLVPALENFRENLRVMMDHRGLTQRDMAKKAKTSHPYINKVLAGKMAPSIPQAERLAGVVEASLSDLLVEPKKFRKAIDNLVSD